MLYFCADLVYGQSPYLHCGLQGVRLEHNLNSKGWNSDVHREFPGNFDSSNVSRDHDSRGIGRITYGWFLLRLGRFLRCALAVSQKHPVL